MIEQVGDIKFKSFSLVAPKVRAVTVIMLLHNILYSESQGHGDTMILTEFLHMLLIK